MSTITLFFDGASRGNPGKAGAGVFLKYPDGTTKELSKPLGIATNNQAEYRSLAMGLKYLVDHPPEFDLNHLEIKGDSQLVVKQLTGQWQVKSDNIRSDYIQTKNLISALEKRGLQVSLNYIKRSLNADADRLANEGADKN